MPSNPAGAVPSNAAATSEHESGYIATEVVATAEPVSAQVAVHQPAREPVAEEPAPAGETVVTEDEKTDYSAYAVRDLVDLCKERGISYSGPAGVLPKPALVARLQEHDQGAGK